MTNVDEAVVARIEKEGQKFEILVDCEKAIEFKQGKNIELNEVLVTHDIFSDVKKGEHASDLEKYFETGDKDQISKKIILEGEVQLTTEYKNKLRDEKRKQIIQIIHRNGINPQNNLPHPPQRIENAIEEARANIDEFKSADEQVQKILEKIKAIIPIKFEIHEISLRIPVEYTGLAYGGIKKFGKLLKENWENNGDLIMIIEVPAGIVQDMYDELNKVTHGSLEAEVLDKR